MAQHKIANVGRQQGIRDGEGTIVDISIIREVGVSGSTNEVLGINVQGAPVPDRRYAADVGYLKKEQGTVKLIFAQTRLDKPQCRSAVVVNLSVDAVQLIMDSINSVQPQFIDIANRLNIPVAQLKEITEEPDQVVQVAASVALSAMSGWDACIDFYEMSPFAVLAATSSKTKTAIDPVVRIQMRSPLFLGMVEAMRAVLKSEDATSKGVV